MKNYSLAFSFLFVSIIIAFFSCKKINEATEIGGDLIPPVDNINTFEVVLNAVTKNSQYSDSTRVSYNDFVALGDINEPEFGKIHANFCFSISAPNYGTYPFKDSISAIDSVVLSLSYQGAYGDTITNGIQTVKIHEIPQNSTFRKDTFYRYNDPNSDFTGGSLLGSGTYTIRNLKDSISVIRKGDTTKVANVVRIRLDNNLGNRFKQFDTTQTSSGGFHNDSIFQTLFRGLSVQADPTGNALAYFNLADSKTSLIVYYQYKKNGVDTSGTLAFSHSTPGQSNFVNVTPGGNWANALTNSLADKIYIQSSPSGSYASIKIPALDTFGNKVIHRAEIIASRIRFPNDDKFSPPARLFLDRKNRNTPDTAFILEKDFPVSLDGSLNFDVFGGRLRSDDTYNFNITRHVQGIITRHEPNDTLRLYAPLRTSVFAPNLITALNPKGTPISLPVLTRIAEGRVILAGGNYLADPNMRLRLRIIYSNL